MSTSKSSGSTLEALQEILRSRPTWEMDLDGLTRFLTSVSEYTRRQGLAMISPLVEEIDDELLRGGLQLLADCIDMKTICETQEPRMHRQRAEMGSRWSSFTAGITAVSKGLKGTDLDAAITDGGSGYWA